MDNSTQTKARSVSAEGLSPEETNHLFQLLQSLNRGNKILWWYTDVKHAAVLIINPLVPGAQTAGDEFMRTPGRALVALGSGAPDPARGRFGLAGAMTEASLRQTLDAILSYWEQTSSVQVQPTAPAVASPAALASSNGSPARRLVDVLHNLLEEDAGAPAFVIKGEGLAQLLVSPKAKKVLFAQPWDDLKRFDFASPVEISDLPMGDPLLPRLIVDGQALHYLLWLVGFHSGGGRLLSFVDPRASYKLNRWPEFGTVDFSNAFLKVMSFLSKSSGTAAELAEWTGIAERDVADLLNACSLCGYLDRAASGARPPDAKPPQEAVEKRSLFNRIRHKLGMVQTGAASS